jgi:subtilisin family serine protease
VGGLTYVTLGQPGFYGNRLFVILKDQADVSAAATMTDYDARRTFVYATLVDHAEVTQADLRSLLDGLRLTYTPYYLVNGLEVRGGWGMRLLLSLHPAVDRVLPSPVLRPLPAGPPPVLGAQPEAEGPTWNQEMVRAPEVWETYGVRGAGIVIGQSDSGVEWTHVELRDSYRGAQNGGAVQHDYHWLDPWFGDREPTDDNGHGTHTLGLANGNRLGVAPEATWIGCKNLGRNLANPALYLDCMQFMLAPYPLDGDPFADGDPLRAAHVLNNSWGCPTDAEGCDLDAVRPAVEALRAAGIFVVVSAGNDGPACASLDTPPAIYDAAFSVGAVDANGRVALFSSMGPVEVDGSGRIKPDIVAPGSGVTAAYPGNAYYTGSGTSQAGPHVAGVVALLWSANPALIGDIDRTEEILRASAAPYRPEAGAPDMLAELEGRLLSLGKEGDCRQEVDTHAVPNAVSGYGVVDAFAAVQMALEP